MGAAAAGSGPGVGGSLRVLEGRGGALPDKGYRGPGEDSAGRASGNDWQRGPCPEVPG